MTLYRPHLCSELNDPDHTVTDCAWCSGVMLANAMTGGKYPSTLAEAEAVEQAAGGPFPGGSPSLVYQGMKTRYGLTPGLATSAAGLIAQVKPGVSGVASGLYGNLPTNYRRWSPYFTGHHETFWACETSGSVWWMDPLGVAATGYSGEGMTIATLSAFLQGGFGGLFAPTKVLATPDPSAYVHTVQVSGLGTGKYLAMHVTPHQSAGILAYLVNGTKVPTRELLLHGESYYVGSTKHTDWLQVAYGSKVGWIKRGFTTLVS